MAHHQRQHHIPQFVLEKFFDEKKRSYFLRKEQPTKIIPVTSFDSIFQKRFQYSTIDINGNRNHALELSWGSIESEVKNIFDNVEGQIRRFGRVTISDIERDSIREYLRMQMKRNPLFLSKLDFPEINEEFVKNATEEHERRHNVKVSPEEIQDFLKPENVKRTIQNATVGAMSLRTYDFFEKTNEKTIVFGFINQDNRSYVIGNYPFTPLNSNALKDPDSELWTVVSPKLAVTFYSPQWQDHVHFPTSDQIRRLNMHTYKLSTEIVSQSEALLKRLANL